MCHACMPGESRSKLQHILPQTPNSTSAVFPQQWMLLLRSGVPAGSKSLSSPNNLGHLHMLDCETLPIVVKY